MYDERGRDMATPMSAGTLVKVLRAAGLEVVEHRSWRSNNRNHKGAWGPVHGVMLHHTVTKGATLDAVNLCYDGHSALPGPLCHGVIAKDGTVYLVGSGRANHAGSGDDDVLRAVVDERPLPADNEANTDGNRYFYGFECINLGDGKDPWPKAQVDAAVRAAAAISRHHGWGPRSTIGHLEWQPGKIDPRGPGWPGMDTARARIGAYIKEGFDPKPSAPKPPAPPKENPVTYQYSQLVRETVLTVPAGQARKVYFDGTDVYDEPNQHGAGGYTAITGKRAYHGVVALWIAEADHPLSVLAVHELADGTTSTSSFADDRTDAETEPVTVSAPIAGMLPVDRKLHIQIRNDGDTALTVTRAELRLFSEARG